MEPSTAAEQLWGTCLVVGAATVFALVALVVKVDPLPLLPATECRFLVSWVISVSFLLWFRRSHDLYCLGPPGLRGMLLLKSMISFGFITLWWAALRRAPVGDCIAILYCSPILTSVFSHALGEKLHPEFLLQVALVAAGSLLVLDPPFLHGGGGEPGHDYSLVFAALLLCSMAPVVTRRTRACSWIEVEHVGSVTACMLMDPALLCGQYALSGTLPAPPVTAPLDALLVVLAAAGAFVGIAMETRGYQLAEPGKATMFRYVEVPFAYLLQRVGTSAPVSRSALAGAGLIVASCAVGGLCQHRRAIEASKAEAEPVLLPCAPPELQGA